MNNGAEFVPFSSSQPMPVDAVLLYVGCTTVGVALRAYDATEDELCCD